jgi:predicted GIY-YIG superfamily endonuclease
MVQCKECGKVKESTQFSKCSSAKNGLQPKCKSCNSKDNLIFRTEKPEHHIEWQQINLDRHVEIVKKYRSANKTPKIYSIKNPNGDVYIGMTGMYLSVRKFEHRAHYKRALKGKRDRLPVLHDSFDKYGIEAHRFEIVVELEGYDRKQLGYVESSFINAFQQAGKSLNFKK